MRGWQDYARVGGGWAAADMEYEWGEPGDHGCENVAAGLLVTHARVCLLCQAGPVDECNEFGRILIVRASPVLRSDWREGQSGAVMCGTRGVQRALQAATGPVS